MKDRGKRVMEWEGFESHCRRHPSQKQGEGICPLCLMERLNNLFCPDCGELKERHSSASSCSCSEASTSSSSAADCTKKLNNGCGGGGGSVEVGSVGRISFLIESDRPEFESPKDASAAILLLRRSKSAAVGTTRAALGTATTTTARAAAEAMVVARSEPRTPKGTPIALPPKKWRAIFSLVLFKKKKKAKDDKDKTQQDCDKAPKLSSVSNSDPIMVSRFVKSRSVAVGGRSFSGEFWENGPGDLKIAAENVYCTPARATELEVKGSNRGGEEIPQPRRRSGRGWSWGFASPMGVFKHSKALKSSNATNNPTPPCSAAEMCRG